jgi:class 3 adenylate cyclase
MNVVFFGDPARWPSAWNRDSAKIKVLERALNPETLDGLSTPPDLVVIEGPGTKGFLPLLDRLRLKLGSRSTIFAGWAKEVNPLDIFVCHNAAIPFLHPGLAAISPDLATAISAAKDRGSKAGEESTDLIALSDNPAFTASLYRNLSKAFSARADPSGLLKHLHDAFALLVDPDIIVFMLHGRPKGEIAIFAGPGLTKSDCEYFLHFCRQDFLETDRFVDLEAMEIEYLEFDSRQIVSKDQHPLSSYWSQSLAGTDGKLLGTVHVGSTSNHYFTTLMELRLKVLAGRMGPLIGSMRRDQALANRLLSLRSLFGKFLPESVIEGLLADDQEGRQDEGRRQKIAILFSDIRGFTTITERNGAEAVVHFLNHHFDAMVAPITANGGMVDKFIGDAIVAVFGLNASAEAPCEAALRAALSMMEALPGVDIKGMQLDGGAYRIGIGIHFGEVVMGYLGSDAKTAFTVIGSTIEIAEGLESSTKAFKVDILLSDDVRSQVSASDLAFRDLGLIEEEGTEPLHVYTVAREAAGVAAPAVAARGTGVPGTVVP